MTKTIGFFGRIRDLGAMVSLMECSRKIGFRPIVAGDGPCVEQLLEGYPELDYRGPFDDTQLRELMAEIDVMFAVYNPERENIRQGALPVKMFDAAAFGRPTVTTAHVPMADFCLENNLGVVASFGDQNSIAKAIEEAYEMDVVSVHSEEDERKKFVTLIESILDTVQEGLN
jgi:glycosyltransferase involved in cell wall biosynthesis